MLTEHKFITGKYDNVDLSKKTFHECIFRNIIVTNILVTSGTQFYKCSFINCDIEKLGMSMFTTFQSCIFTNVTIGGYATPILQMIDCHLNGLRVKTGKIKILLEGELELTDEHNND